MRVLLVLRGLPMQDCQADYPFLIQSGDSPSVILQGWEEKLEQQADVLLDAFHNDL